MKRVVYLTFNDAPTGIYFGQVTDVCKFWNESLAVDARLIAFVSLRGFFATRKKIRAASPGATVLPMFPKTRNWKKNIFLLRLFLFFIRPEVLVARGPFATGLALHFQKKCRVCFDGRGAYIAELNEYNVVPDELVKKSIAQLERQAVLQSDFRLAVSNALVQYWRDSFGYNETDHVVIPCTLNTGFFESHTDTRAEVRKQLGWSADACVLVYSGSSAGWQTLEELDHWLLPLMQRDVNVCVLLLTKDVPDKLKIAALGEGRVLARWLAPEAVSALLRACDYGWLVREQSVTNQVASPVKFAEYLASGLRVIVSEGLGDYPEFIRQHQAGIVVKHPDDLQKLTVATGADQTHQHNLAEQYFTKKNFLNEYRKLLSCTSR